MGIVIFLLCVFSVVVGFALGHMWRLADQPMLEAQRIEIQTWRDRYYKDTRETGRTLRRYADEVQRLGSVRCEGSEAQEG